MGLADAVGTFDDALAQLLAIASPTRLGGRGRAGGLFRNHPKGVLMNDRTDPLLLIGLLLICWQSSSTVRRPPPPR